MRFGLRFARRIFEQTTGGETGGAAGGTPAAPAAGTSPAPAAAAAKMFTQEEVAALLSKERDVGRTRGARDVLAKAKELGVQSEEELVALAKAGDEARKAQMTAEQKAAEKVAKLEADLKAATERAERNELEAKRATLFADANVHDRQLAKLLHNEAIAEAKAKGEAFDDAKWLDEQKTARPFLFKGTDSAATQGAAANNATAAAPKVPANTVTAPVGAPPATVANTGAAPAVDCMKMSAKEFAEFENRQGLR